MKDVVSRLRADRRRLATSRARSVAEHRASTVSQDGRSVVVNFTLPGTAETVEEMEALEHVRRRSAGRRRRGPEGASRACASRSTAPRPSARRSARRSAPTRPSRRSSRWAARCSSCCSRSARSSPPASRCCSASPPSSPPPACSGRSASSRRCTSAVAQVVMLVGLAVGVDYAMFYLRRMMEEQRQGPPVGGRAGHRRRHVGPRGADLRLHRDGRHGAGCSSRATRSSSPSASAPSSSSASPSSGRSPSCPRVLSYLGQKGWLEKGRVPVGRQAPSQAPSGESRVWSAILDRVLARPLVSAILAGGLLVALSVPALGMQFKEPGTEGMSRSQPIIQTLDRIDAAFPGGSVPATVVVKAKDVTTPEVQAAIQDLHDEAIATGQLSRALGVEISPGQDGRHRGAGHRRQGHRRGVQPLDRGPARAGRARHGRPARRRRGGRERRDGLVEGLPRHDEVAPADRVRLRAQPGLHPAAGHVPLDRRPDQGDRPQPAVGRRRLRHPDARLPGRPRREAARVHLGRRHRALAPAVPLRDPVRPLDGLPRVRPEPDPRGGRPRDVHGQGGRPRHQDARPA